MTAHRFYVEAPLAGERPKVSVAGEEVYGVEAVVVRSDPNGVTRLYLTLSGEGIVAGEGIVHVVEDVDQRQVVAEWLSKLDGDTLSKAVLDRTGAGAPPPIHLALEVLREWALAPGPGVLGA